MTQGRKGIRVVTIRQIAERCEVSTSTVSKALNGAEDVSRSTMKRIRQVAQEMGYMPSAAARTMKTGRSYCFGILMPDSVASTMPHEFFTRIYFSFDARASELGYDITNVNNHYGKRKVTLAEHARYRNCDGVLILTGSDEDNSIIPEMIDTDIPIVCIDLAYPGCGSVSSDNTQGMRELTRHIIGFGHRKIAFIHGHLTPVTRTRIRTFLDTCAESGIRIPEEYLIAGLYHAPEASEKYTRQLLALSDPPTCIIYPDDLSCIGGINELERQGVSIPKDISIAAYDGLIFSQAFHPKLTTFQQNAGAIGRCAAEELVRAVENRENYDFRQIVIPGTLLPGETVGPIPT